MMRPCGTLNVPHPSHLAEDKNQNKKSSFSGSLPFPENETPL
jgi:hypothetical protein